MEQFDSSVEESSIVSEQQQKNDEQQCPSCVAELTEASVWMIAANHLYNMSVPSACCILTTVIRLPASLV